MSLRAWLESRWDGPERLSAVLSKPLPRNVSWLHTLGSLLLIYLIFQMLTGILLGLYYNPSPEHAYASIRYLDSELFLGRFVHQLHRYGAGFVLVTAFLHMIRSYFLAAYKSPRELLWISGSVLLILLTFFAFTGQLLPYDQRGYWATVVGLKIVSSPPAVGGMIRSFLTGGYGDIGAVSLSRFYILHVSVLPLLVVVFVFFHLGILQKVGSAGPASEPAPPEKPFYPAQAYKDVLVAAAGAVLLFLSAAFLQAAETGPANPTSNDFVPRPEWYFMSHYQFLRLLPSGWQIIGTFVAPTLLVVFVLLLPFIDRKPERSMRRRPVWVGAGVLFCLGLVVFTIQGLVSVPDVDGAQDVEGSDAEGKTLFREMNCIECHSIAGQGGGIAPDLTRIGQRLQADYMRDWIRNPQSFDPDTEMPAFDGSEPQLNAIVEYLMSLSVSQ